MRIRWTPTAAADLQNIFEQCGDRQDVHQLFRLSGVKKLGYVPSVPGFPVPGFPGFPSPGFPPSGPRFYRVSHYSGTKGQVPAD